MNIVVVGYGGHGQVVADLVTSTEEHHLLGFLDDRFIQVTFKKGLYLGPIGNASELIMQDPSVKFVVAIGNNLIRKSIVGRMGLPHENFMTLIHDTAIISPSAAIGWGSVVMPHAVINANSYIGYHSIINTGSIVEHDCIVKDYTHISPSSTLTGGVQVGEGSQIGAGATVIPSVTIGNWAVIGAGATVTRKVPSRTTAVGVPAKLLHKTTVRWEYSE